VLIIEKHRQVLARLGLETLDQFKRYGGEAVQPNRNRREVLRIRTTDDDGRELVLFLKRNWCSHKKDGFLSLLRHGRVWSQARQEWENSKAMQRAGVKTATLVAYAEECGPCWEKFSCLLTEAAAGTHNVEQFVRERREPPERRRILKAVARGVRRMHEAGVSTPDLYGRHVFLDPASPSPSLCLIDVARLHQGIPLSAELRVRALAALNVSVPVRFVSLRERLEFLNAYAGRVDRKLFEQIQKRTEVLLSRKKYPNFLRRQSSNSKPRLPSPSVSHAPADV
jgi:hypothetical protein